MRKLFEFEKKREKQSFYLKAGEVIKKENMLYKYIPEANIFEEGDIAFHM